MEYQVKVTGFEGPLDLLYYLIKRSEIDIYDIPIGEITDQYLQYIRSMEQLSLNVASEYLVMAATLLAIKSNNLLPKQKLEIEDELCEETCNSDPMADLVSQLLEYQQFKEASKELEQLANERSLLMTNAPCELSQIVKGNSQGEITDKIKASVYDMLVAYRKLQSRNSLKKPLQTTIKRPQKSVASCMEELLQKIEQNNGETSFTKLVYELDKPMFVLTFLAILELLKEGKVDISQKENLDEIRIFLKLEARKSCT